MNKRRYLTVIAAVALALVLAVGAAGSALAFGPWGQAQPTPPAQGQEDQDGQAWTCPMAGDDQTAQAMREAMQNGDYDRMQELMRERFGEGFQGMMPGANADTMRQHMQGADFGRMQELMRDGNWDGMREYMQGRGLGDSSMMTPGQGLLGPGGMMGGRGGMMGGGMMGGR
jgi:hypothetical protein